MKDYHTTPRPIDPVALALLLLMIVFNVLVLIFIQELAYIWVTHLQGNDLTFFSLYLLVNICIWLIVKVIQIKLPE